jgi:hypothetical protein
LVQLKFDARTVEPSVGFDPVPAGWYQVMMDESGPMTPAKSNPQNSFLPLRFTIVDGQYKGKKLFTNLNIVNSNAQAQEIAYRDLSAIAHACGQLQLETSEQLHNIPLWVKAKIKPGTEKPGGAVTADGTVEKYPDRNEIESYKPISFVPPGTAAVATAPSAVVPPPVVTPPAAVVAPPAAAPAPAPVAAPAAAPVYEMAPGETFTREQYHAAGWTDETLIAGNKMRVKPAAAPAPAPAAPPPGPAAPATMPWAAAPAQPWEATTTAAAGPATPPAPVTPPPPAAVAAQQASAPWNTAPKA